MKPISEERLAWIDERLTALDLTIAELNQSPARHIAPGDRTALVQASGELRAERARLSAERTALRRHLDS